MKTNYILIDYENVQPKNLALLQGHDFKVLVFVGANQAKIPFELAAAVQELGGDAGYVKISGNGPNALDFHIAFYLGQLAERDPDGFFHVISKDTGFDPLIRHLKERKIFVQRERDLAEIPLLRLANGMTMEEKLDAVIKNLAGRGTTRPRKPATLANTIRALFLKKLAEPEVTALVGELEKRRLIEVVDGRISYRPPISQT